MLVIGFHKSNKYVNYDQIRVDLMDILYYQNFLVTIITSLNRIRIRNYTINFLEVSMVDQVIVRCSTAAVELVLSYAHNEFTGQAFDNKAIHFNSQIKSRT